MGSLRKHLLMAAVMAGMAQNESKLFSDAGEKRIVRYDGDQHNSLNQTKRQRKVRKNKRRIASRMRAYNRR